MPRWKVIRTFEDDIAILALILLQRQNKQIALNKSNRKDLFKTRCIIILYWHLFISLLVSLNKSCLCKLIDHQAQHILNLKQYINIYNPVIIYYSLGRPAMEQFGMVHSLQYKQIRTRIVNERRLRQKKTKTVKKHMGI